MLYCKEIKLQLEEVLDETQGDLDRDIIITVCQSALVALTEIQSIEP